MRVAVVGAGEVGSLGLSFVRGARAAGHDAHHVEATQLVAGWRPLFLARRAGFDGLISRPFARALERRLVELEPDVVVVVKGRFIDARTVQRLRDRLGCPLLNYYPDHPLYPGHDDPQTLAALRHYDEVAVWAPDVAEALAGRGLRTRVVPFGYDPDDYGVPPQPHARRHDVVMIGQRYDDREAFVAALADLRTVVSGMQWDRAADPAVRRIARTRTYPAAEICRYYWESAFGLNIVAPWNAPSHNMRTFEIPAAGTAMIATRTPEHEQLFGEDGAVLVSEPDEARARVLELLDDEEALRAIAARGRERVAPFTYAARFEELLAPWA